MSLSSGASTYWHSITSPPGGTCSIVGATIAVLLVSGLLVREARRARSRLRTRRRCLELKLTMSVFNLQGSLERAARKSTRRVRSDRGRSRLEPRLAARLDALLSGQERPPVHVLARELGRHAARLGLRPPARATLYAALERAKVPAFENGALPESVRQALHNLADDALVPGHQVAFAAFNRGDVAALCFGAGLPWSCLAAASRLPGFRPKSRALLHAVMRYRGI